MIFGSASDFIDHPIPKNSTGPPTTLGPQAPRHLNPALEKPIVSLLCGFILLVKLGSE